MCIVIDTFILKKLIADAVIGVGGIIFGGFVRDTIRRQHCRKLKQIFDSSTDLDSDIPELDDADLEPTDIDCALSKKKQKLLKKKLRELGLLVSRSETNSEYDEYQHIRWEVSTHFADITNTLSKLSPHTAADWDTIEKTVIVDIMPENYNEKDYHPFVDAIDFRCNAFFFKQQLDAKYDEVPILSACMFPDSATPEEQLTTISDCLSDIYKKQAVVVELAPSIRIDKMRAKGYVVRNYPIWEPFVKLKEIADDECFVCLEKLDIASLKSECCSAKLHCDCYNDLISDTLQAKCPICNKGAQLEEHRLTLYVDRLGQKKQEALPKRLR